MRTSALFVLLACFGLACSACKAADLSTDPGVHKAFKAATGSEWHEDNCIGRTGVRDVILVGGFAHDRGCIVEGGFVGGTWMATDALMSRGLGALGWATMDAAAKATLAREWTDRVVFHWDGSVVAADAKAFSFDDTPAFTPPEVKAAGDAVVVTLWIEQPPGMQDIDVFEQIEVRIDAAGAVTKSQKAAFSVDGSRTRG